MPCAKATTMDQVMADPVAGRRFSMLLLASLGVCAMRRSGLVMRQNLMLIGAGTAIGIVLSGRLLHSRAPRHARGPDDGDAQRIRYARIR
jgi:hypothetical protein